MIFWWDETLPTLNENLALDEALLLQAEDGGPEVLRVWEWPTSAVVLGAAGRIRDEIDIERCQSDGVSIHRRASGGGTVLLDRGCLLFSLILAYERDPMLKHIRPSYRFILGKIIEAFTEFAQNVACQGTSDIVLGDRKISGNSQKRKRNHLLHHGTILYEYDVNNVGRYLRMPPRQPDYRRQRTHDEFLTNLPIDKEQLRKSLQSAWMAQGEMPDWLGDRIRELVEGKYALREWVFRR